MSGPLGGFVGAAADLAETSAMLRERIPGIGPLLDAKMAEVAAEITEIFQPFNDFADGKITQEEYLRIMDEREAAELVKRTEMWEAYHDEDSNAWLDVPCSGESPDCKGTVDFEDEPPPLYPECEECEDYEEPDEDEEFDFGLPAHVVIER